MIRKLVGVSWKKYLIDSLFFFFLCGNSLVYGFERGPIIVVGGLQIYRPDPQSACEFRFYELNPIVNPNILKLGVKPIPHNSSGPNSPGPATAYECKTQVKYLHNGAIVEGYAGFVYPVCNVGDFPSGSNTSDMICTIPSNIPDKDTNTGRPELGSCVGNPVNTATGNKYAEEVDIVFSRGLSFSRYYNAKGLSGGSQIGSAWSHTFNRNLFVNSETITATRPDGKLGYFRLINSAWINQQAGGDALAQIAGGSGWQLTTSNDVIETYNTTGRLLTISNREGRTQTLSYDTNGRLATVTDDTGRALSFTYDGSSRIQTMTDPGNGLYQYTYDAAGNLTSVTYPDGKTRTYHYNEPAYTS
ncbi:MAG: DUF6531 domain-containing protein, partial [Nitrosomonas sp.]|nr:DUF6531 domain-containing protein [Nitrosomonas sp.]